VTETSEATAIDWAPGDMLGLQVPAHAEALREGGAGFLTRAFRAAGALSADNQVVAITQFEDCPGGSTGRKLLLAVEYARPEPGLHTELFVKFSRDFADPIRDRGKDQMEAEVRLGLLSRVPGFPIAVPACLYADYHHASGTGALITQRIAFGTGTTERAWDKCLDYEMPEPLAHYRVLLTAIARLAGTQRSGRLAEAVAEKFPFDAERAAAADPIRYDARQLQNRISRYAEFAQTYPQILPDNIRDPAFIAKLRAEVPLFLEQAPAIKRFLQSRPDMVALCHWNANVDNAWFWRGETGELECGLMDWGRVNQMNVALAIWGCMSAAETEIWDDHLDELLQLFVAEFEKAGGPALEVAELKLNIALFVAMLGLAWLMDAPPLIQRHVPDLDQAKDRCDPRFEGSEVARTQLHMLTNFLNLWQTHDFGRVLETFKQRA
jgi:hypothetical protein